MTDAKGLEDALVEVGIALARDGYHFWTPTPETHAKVVARLKDERGDEIVAKTKQDLWGWSLPVRCVYCLSDLCSICLSS